MEVKAFMLVVLMAAAGVSGAAADESVLTYHCTADRSGLYVASGLAKAATVRLDTGFHATVDGAIYGQPLYGAPSGAIMAPPGVFGAWSTEITGGGSWGKAASRSTARQCS
jgi:hypothetical protein